MKQCRKCDRTYPDDLKFCRFDGEPLILSPNTSKTAARTTMHVKFSFPQEGRRVEPVSSRKEAGVKPRATYKFTRLCFKKAVIEPLDWADEFRVITPAGTFQMSKAEFYDVFANVTRTLSYQENGIYHYSTLPKKARQFLVKDI